MLLCATSYPFPISEYRTICDRGAIDKPVLIARIEPPAPLSVFGEG
jgi:hypothetical protein